MNEILKLLKAMGMDSSIGARPDIAVLFFVFFVIALVVCIYLSKRSYLQFRKHMIDEASKGESFDEGI
ncbi:MAG TPA: hypothetical protein VHP81_06570 [Lachnospiraceae bacterium]|nr:hypothetical protein [Lachnospiraceae bacterium]